MANSLIKKTRKPRDPFKRAEKAVTHITEDQFILRHQYCVYVTAIQRDIDRSQYVPANVQPVCDHPEDGVCGTWISPEELRKVNDRLAGKGSETSVEMSTPSQVRTRQRRSEPKAVKYFCMKCEDWHTLDPDPLKLDGIYGQHFPFKRHRGQRLPSQLKPKEPAKYFCTKCNDWHKEEILKKPGDRLGRDYETHAKYKRKRGRQKGWNKK